MSPTRAPQPPRRSLRPRIARVASLLLAAVLVAGGAPFATPPPARAADAELTPAAAEARMLALLNQDRASAGLVPFRPDTRMNAIARARATDMATKNYFSHTQPDGRKVFDLIEEANITWYGAGEIIAWNNWPTLDSSAAAANEGWLGSSSHRAVILSSGYNYVGVGMANADNGKVYWVAVALKGPDRTGAVGEMRRLARTTGSPRDDRYPVRITWAGRDVRLQVLTAGLRNYDVQRRINGGSWRTIWYGTTATSRVRYLQRGHVYEYRVRARDNRGNVGRWSAPFSLKL